MEDKIYKAYLLDLMSLIIEDALEAKEDNKKQPTDFNRGRMIGYLEVLTTIKNQAHSFELEEKDIGLDRINIDEYL